MLAQLKLMTLQERENLCNILRNTIKETVAHNGGHLASNLGVVELTVALHSVFDSPNDKFVFDVGHQCYAHKILTGRGERFRTLRTEGGISGFVFPAESEHDAFISGHSSISVSAAAGIAAALAMDGSKNKVIAILGDGALTGGQAYEGLNNACLPNLIVVLNDNEMSISKNSGGIAKYLNRIRLNQGYYKAKDAVKGALSKNAAGRGVAETISGAKHLVKNIVYSENIFENLGFKYFGPVEGHNLKDLTEVLSLAKIQRVPCIVHVKTKKGKGFYPAEINPGEYHNRPKSGTEPFYVETAFPEAYIKRETFSEIFGREMEKIGEDKRVVLITAAMKYATGCNFFAKAYKDRFFDVGIAEQHAVTFAAGLASRGKLPVFAVYSTFLQRTYDQLIHDIAIPKLHAVIAVDRAGVIGADGITHQGIFDVAMLKTIPNISIYSPSCSVGLRQCLNRAVFTDSGLAAVRYPRGRSEVSEEDKRLCGVIYRDYIYIREGDSRKSKLILTYGRISSTAMKLSKYADFISLVKIFPVEEEVFETARQYKHVYFFEEGIRGGIGEYFAEHVPGIKIRAIEGFVECAETEVQLAKAGLDYNGMRGFINADL